MSGLPIQFPFVAGVDEGIDPKTAAPGRLSRLVNAAWRKDGLLDKRDGTEGLVKTRSDSGSITSAAKLATRDGELLVIDTSGVLFSYSPELASWVPKGQMPEVGLKWSSFGAADGIRCADSAKTSDGKIVEAWVSGDPGRSDADSGAGIGGVSSAIAGGTLYVRVLDAETGAELSHSAGISGTKITMCRVVASGTSFAIIYDDSTAIKLMKSDLTTVVSLISDGAGEFGYMPFDAVAVGTSIIVGTYRPAGTKVRVSSYNFAGASVVAATDVITTGNADHVSAIGLHATAGENLYVVVGNKSAQAGSKVQFAVHNPTTLVQTLAPTTIGGGVSGGIIQHVGVTRVDATHAVACWSILTGTAGTTYMDGATCSQFISASGVTGSFLSTWFTRMISRPFNIGSKIYMFVSDTPATVDTASRVGVANTIQQQYPGVNSYLVGVDDVPSIGGLPHRYVGRVDVLIAGSWQYGHAPLPFALSSTDTRAVLPYQAEAATDGYQLYQGIRRMQVLSGADLPKGHWSTVEVGGEAYFAGAVLMAYDSIAPFDYGFPRCSPIAVDDSQVGSSLRGNGGGGAMVDGTYIYQTVPVFTSGAGVVHRGPPSPPIRFALAHGGANDNNLRLAIIDQTLGCKQQLQFMTAGSNLVTRAPRHEIYRSEKDLGDMHRRTIEPGDMLELNSPMQQPNTSLTDTKADASISQSPSTITLASRPLIYSASELAEIAPPSSLGLHLHRNRLMSISGNERELWITKDATENPGIAPGFDPTQLLVFDDKLVGVRTLGFNYIVFSESGIFTVEGAGPAANGEGSDYSPIRVPTDKGCVNPRSLVTMPLGIMYESPVGISLLDAGLQVSWIGSPVQDTLAAFPVITSATLDAVQNKVRFTCNAEDGASGVVLVFDYIRKQWSVFKYYDTDAAVASTPIADAIIWNDVWTFVTPGGKVYVEDDSTCLDDGSHWVEADIETTENYATGPLGYQRVRRIGLLGSRFTDCDLRIRVAVNGSASYDQDHTFTSDVVAAIGSANLTRVVKTQKNGSIRVRFTDATPTGLGAVVGSGRGLNYSAVGFEVEPIEGMNRRAARAVA